VDCRLIKVRPAPRKLLRNGRRGYLRDLGRFFFDFLLFSLSPGDVTVGAKVTDQLFSLIGDVGGDLRDPVQDREQGKVSLKVRVHLGAVEHGLGIFLVSHLLLREGGTEDILGQALPSMTVVTLDLDLIVNIEAGVFPGEELVDQFPADFLFPEQHLNDSAEPLTPFPDSEGPLGAYTITPVDYILPLFGAGKITPIADNTEFGLGQSGSSILPSLLEGQYSSAAVVPHLQDVAIGVLEVGRSFSQSLGSESSRAALPGLLTVLDESSRERRILGLVHGQAHVIH